MKDLKYTLFMIGLVSVNQYGLAAATLSPGQAKAILSGNILEIETCYNQRPESAFKPAMSLKVGRYETSGYLIRQQDRASCFSFKATVKDEVIKDGDEVTIKIDGQDLRAIIQSRDSVQQKETTQTATEAINLNKEKAEKVGQEYAHFRIAVTKDVAKGYAVFLSELQDLASRVHENLDYEPRYRQKLQEFEKEAEVEGLKEGGRRAEEDATIAARKLVEARNDNNDSSSQVSEQSVIEAALNSYRGASKETRSESLAQFIEHNWNVNSMRELVSQILGLGQDNQELIYRMDVRLVQFAVQNVRASMASEISEQLSSDRYLMVGPNVGLTATWLEDQKQPGFPNAAFHREYAQLIAKDYAANQAFKEAYERIINEKRRAIFDSINNLRSRDSKYDALAIAAGIVFEKLKNSWLDLMAKNQAYKTKYAASSISGYQQNYPKVFGAEMVVAQERLNNSPLFKADEVRVFANGTELLLQGENAIGIGDFLSVEFVGARNIGGQALNSQIHIDGSNVVVSSGIRASVELGPKQARDISLFNIAVVSAGENNSTVLNEVYPVTFGIDSVNTTRTLRIDWSKTFMALSRSETSPGVRSQILSFIQSKLFKEWKREAGGFTNWYQKAEENGGTSLIATLAKYVSTSSYATRELLRSDNFLERIRTAYPEKRPGFFSWTKAEYDSVQGYLKKIEENLSL